MEAPKFVTALAAPIEVSTTLPTIMAVMTVARLMFAFYHRRGAFVKICQL